MNLKLHNVISQLTGKSGLAILKSIVGGERDVETLLGLCDVRIKASKAEEVCLSLEGHYKPAYVFMLSQAIGGWEFCQQQMRACDQQIDDLMSRMMADLPPIDVPADNQSKPIRHNKPTIEDLHTKLMQLTGGANPALLPGITDLTLLKLIGETGTDMSAWPTEKHFVSWIGLSPMRESSGKRTRHRKRRGKNLIALIFRQAAQSVARSKYLALGGFYRRIRAKKGPKVANKATARKIAVLYYRVMKYGLEYVEAGLAAYEEQYRQQKVNYLIRQAKKHNMLLVDIQGTIQEVH